MSTKADREKKVFRGPGQPNAADAIIEAAHSQNNGLHDGTVWANNKIKDLKLGDLYDMAGFHEKTGNGHAGGRALTTLEISRVIKALEQHNDMNYFHGSGYGGGGAVPACCTCA